MSAVVDVSQIQSSEKSAGPRLAGIWQKISISGWAVLFLFCLLCAVMSISALNIWDRVPAAESHRYLANLTDEFVAGKAAFQQDVLATGLSLAVFANTLTAFRAIGSLALFILSALVVRRYPRHLMAVLFSILLAVMGAVGVWLSPLSAWSTLLAPWMAVPGKVLNLLLWFGLIFLYAFPDGRFTPRWTMGLGVLLIPIVIAMAFDLPVFFNPRPWPAPLDLLPNFLFIGAALFSVLYRYGKADLARKAQLRGFVLGITLLICLYFILLFITDIYGDITGHSIFSSSRDVVVYTLVSEPLWYVLELAFAIGTARSLFRGRLLD